MRQDLQEKLFNIEPGWFNRGDVRNSAMAFGFEIGDGWFDIVWSLLSDAHWQRKSWDQRRARGLKLLAEGTEEARKTAAQAYGKELGIADVAMIGEKLDPPRNPFDPPEYEEGERPDGSAYRMAVASGFQVVQVKEKYAGLRFYIEGGTREYDDAVHAVEGLSYLICERCGEPGRVTGKGWVTTLCQLCEIYKAAGTKGVALPPWRYEMWLSRKLPGEDYDE